MQFKKIIQVLVALSIPGIMLHTSIANAHDLAYKAIPFVFPPGTGNNALNSINNRGESVGEGTNSGNVGLFGYPNGTVVFIPDLTNKCGGASSGGAFNLYGINDKGQIAGLCNSNPMIYTVKGGIEILATNAEGEYFGARAINNAGQVAGYGYISDIKESEALVFLSNQTIVYLGNLKGTAGSHAFAYGINDRQGLNGIGQVVGATDSFNSTGGQAFFYENGQMINIGAIIYGTGYCTAYQINNESVVVGTGQPNGLSAFVYDAKTGNYTTFPNRAFNAINNEGWVVGLSDLYNSKTGVFYNLDQLTLPINGVQYNYNAQDINDRGQILALQSLNNKGIGYALLTPINSTMVEKDDSEASQE